MAARGIVRGPAPICRSAWLADRAPRSPGRDGYGMCVIEPMFGLSVVRSGQDHSVPNVRSPRPGGGRGRDLLPGCARTVDRIGREPVASGVLRGRSGWSDPSLPPANAQAQDAMSIEGPAPRSPLIDRALSVGRVP